MTPLLYDRCGKVINSNYVQFPVELCLSPSVHIYTLDFDSHDVVFVFLIRMMAVPATVIYFTSYERLKVLFVHENGKTEDWWKPMAAGALARGEAFLTIKTDSITSVLLEVGQDTDNSWDQSNYISQGFNGDACGHFCEHTLANILKDIFTQHLSYTQPPYLGMHIMKCVTQEHEF